ncbi:MAG: zinc ribbon domain-containing protein [Thermoleophilia bacterium]|nr:zinc ribbon domain-containing protein [Thermoleophilia bacterium]MDH4340621.1 zinc ribbon domain-containing protein [Thermoleophilia bacterium]MDH5282026.1 zinc ribbon domain-containing protein [Thermoleophilia bacterium]
MKVFVCTSCGRAVFPHRLLCPDCGSSEWREERVEHGVLEAAVEREVRVGAVRTPLGPLAITRIESDAEPGAEVSLDQDGDTPLAR